MFIARWRCAAAWQSHCRPLALLLAVAGLAGCRHAAPQPLEPGRFLEALEARPSALAGGETSNTLRLSLEQAEAAALRFNPRLRLERQRAQVPVRAAADAGRWEDPELSVDAARLLQPDPLQEPWILGGGLSFTLPISGRLAIERSVASAEGRAALAGAWVAEQQVLLEVRRQWVELVSRRRAAAASEALLEQLTAVVKATDTMESVGELVRTEAAAFRVARAREALLAESLEADAEISARELRALLGVRGNAPVDFLDSPAARATAVHPSREALLAGSPAILQCREEYAVAEEALRLELRKQYPDLSVGPTLGREDGQNRAGLGVSLPLPILNANRHAITKALAERDAARTAWEHAVEETLSRASTLEARLAAAETRRRQLETVVLPMAREQLAGARLLASQGELRALLLLESLREVREVTLELIEAEKAVQLLRVEIHALAPEIATTAGTDHARNGEAP